MCGEQGSCAREIAGKEKTPEPVLPSRLTLQKFQPQGVTRASGGVGGGTEVTGTRREDVSE